MAKTLACPPPNCVGDRDRGVRTLFAEVRFYLVSGARPLKRAIQERIENPLAKQIVEGKIAAKDRIVVEVKKGKISFRKA